MSARVSGPESMDGAAAADVHEYILTSPPKPGGGEFGSFYSSSALRDQRIGNLILVTKMPSSNITHSVLLHR
ncbi:hypothetical protein C4D60_Mb02t14780 [Musa balbisiana]|uniref:Uncharacterized protein n=1 Tax=Musa balbisiana TaxID=52838 RepID=A0A4S8IAS1_MUSBA|nr:hypothetical protein C4D60_Mb02t14780 [Musa balbisiana]